MKVLRIFLIVCILCLFPYIIYGLGVYDLEQNNEVEIVNYSVLDCLEEANVENYRYLIDNDALLLRKSGVVENECITREDFLTMFFRLMTDYRYHEVSESPYYIDVQVRDWYAGYVEWARYNGVARGYGNEVWGIGDYLTVEQMCKMVHGYVEFNDLKLSLSNSDFSSCLDLNDASDWAKDSIKWCLRNHLILLDVGYLNPLSEVSWEDAISFIVSFDRVLIKE